MMVWDESEAILAERPDDRADIEKLDGFLADRRLADLIDPRRAARAVGIGERRAVELLDAFENHRVVRSTTMIECPTCEQLSPSSEVRQAQDHGDDYPCVRGDEDLTALDAPVEVRVFRLLSEPPPRIED